MPLFSLSDSTPSSRNKESLEEYFANWGCIEPTAKNRSTRLFSDEDLKLNPNLNLSTVRTNLFPVADKSSTILRQSTERAEIPVSVSVPVYERVEYRDKIVTKEVPVTKEVFVDREVRCCGGQRVRVPARVVFSFDVF